MIRNFADLVERAKQCPPQRIVIVGTENETVLSAVHRAQQDGFAVPVLVGSEASSISARKMFAQDVDNFTIKKADEHDISAEAVSLVRGKQGDILLKGSVSTAAMMRAVLDKESGLTVSGLLSDSFLFEDARRAGNQLIDITDGGVVLYPDVEQKQAILENAVRVYHALGHSRPKVAICAAIEKVNEKMPPTIDAAELHRRYRNGEISGCIVDGPLALDVALSKEALRIKGIESELAGEADILVMPSIEAANLVAKSVQVIAGKEAAHVIIGASVPLLIPSRSDTAQGKYLSLALATIINAG